jgi:putative transcriptional regulator
VNLRKRVGLRQQDLAFALNKRQATISDWERGATIPHLTPSETLALIQVLNCTLEELAEAFDPIKKGTT